MKFKYQKFDLPQDAELSDMIVIDNRAYFDLFERLLGKFSASSGEDWGLHF